jgi:hypothetical protein
VVAAWVGAEVEVVCTGVEVTFGAVARGFGFGAGAGFAGVGAGALSGCGTDPVAGCVSVGAGWVGVGVVEGGGKTGSAHAMPTASESPPAAMSAASADTEVGDIWGVDTSSRLRRPPSLGFRRLSTPVDTVKACVATERAPGPT